MIVRWWGLALAGVATLAFAGAGAVILQGVGLPGETAEHGAATPTGAAAAAAGLDSDAQAWENVPYDGRFTLARIRFEARGWSDLSWSPGGGRQPPWAHDFPLAERRLMQLVQEISFIRPSFEGGNIFRTDDPELMRFPVAYIVEPGFWEPSEAEVEGLRNYLLKGGFLIVDDFLFQHWNNFQWQMERVLPGYDFHELDVSAPIFHTYLSMENLDFPHPYSWGAQPTYLAMYEDNDPTQRIMVMVNWQQDLGDYWEYSATGRYPVDGTSEAFKTGVNYLIYGMTH